MFLRGGLLQVRALGRFSSSVTVTLRCQTAERDLCGDLMGELMQESTKKLM